MRRPYIIAEIGSNHNGSIDTARALIQEAQRAGADAVKVQLFTADKLYHPSDPAYKAVKAQEMSRYWCEHLKAYSLQWAIDFSATPCDLEVVQLLDELGVPWIKIASGDVTYHRLIKAAAATGRPLIMSTGLATSAEIAAASKVAKDAGCKDLTVLYCESAYPAEVENHDLRMIDVLQEEGHFPVGLSDHTLSVDLPCMAVKMGALVVEKHFTLSRSQEGPDHGHSLEPHEFAQMVRKCRKAWRTPNPSRKQELCKHRQEWRRGLYWAKDLPAGHVVQPEDVVELRPVNGYFGADQIGRIIGRKLRYSVRGREHVRVYEAEEPSSCVDAERLMP